MAELRVECCEGRGVKSGIGVRTVRRASKHTTLNTQLPKKSAYELPMERLKKLSPNLQITHAQKTTIAEIESAAKAKIAEQELFLKDKIAEAAAEGKAEEAGHLEHQLTHEIRRINEDAEAKKA